MQCAGSSPRAEQRAAFRVAQAAARFTNTHKARQLAGKAPGISSVRSIDAEAARLLTKALGSVPVSPREHKNSLIASPRISCGDSLGADRECLAPVVDRCRAFELLETLEHGQDTQPEARTELLALLHTFDFFRHFDAADAILLAQLSERMRIHRGHPLFLQGDSDEDGVFLVLHGTLSLHFDPAGCEEHILANAEAWDDAYHGREAPSHGAELENNFGLKVASEGAGSVLGENALLDEHLQAHKPLATGATRFCPRAAQRLLLCRPPGACGMQRFWGLSTSLQAHGHAQRGLKLCSHRHFARRVCPQAQPGTAAAKQDADKGEQSSAARAVPPSVSHLGQNRPNCTQHPNA